ncbi:MAG: cobalt ECF transporter T component CbiQ [Spirochaetia bacterium]|nr:cobalt ECF transporter T component CbiQ [Spirochaetia bacterium]
MHIFAENFHQKNIVSGNILFKSDARLKIFTAAAALAMNLSSPGIIFPFIIICICLMFIIYLKIPLKIFILRFSEPVFIALVLFVLKTFFSGGETISFVHIGAINIEVSRNGLAEGLRLASRIISSVAIVALLGFSTPFAQFAAALAWFKVPAVFLEICLIAYRYIFVLVEEAATIYEAQKIRLGYSGLLRGLKSLGTLTGALTIKVFDHSQKITTSMIQRGYDGSIPLLKNHPVKLREIFISFSFLGILGAVWTL